VRHNIGRNARVIQYIIDQPENISRYVAIILYIIKRCPIDIVTYAVANCRLNPNDSWKLLMCLIRVRPLKSDLIIQLINRENIDLNSVNTCGQQAIHYAIVYSTKQVVSYLVSLNVDLDKMDAKNFAPIHYALRRGDLEIFLVIAPHIDLNKLYHDRVIYTLKNNMNTLQCVLYDRYIMNSFNFKKFSETDTVDYLMVCSDLLICYKKNE
jgi:hypothetical protein